MPDRQRARITPEQIEELRQRLHRKVDQGIEKLLGLAEQGLNPYELDFTGRETLVVEWGQEVTALLLEANILYDGHLAIVEASASWTCPRCQHPSPRHKDNDGKECYDELTLSTRAGKIPLRLPRFRCPQCRKVFSPLPTERRSPSGPL